MDDVRKCAKNCGRTLGAANKSGVCSVCQGSYKPKGETAKTPPIPESTEPDWQKQFFQLAEALGLNPEEMLTDFCRGWVEDTRRRALGDPKPETPVSE